MTEPSIRDGRLGALCLEGKLPLDIPGTEALLVHATHAQKLAMMATELIVLDADCISETCQERARAALSTCREVARVTANERRELLQLLKAGGIGLAAGESDAMPQTLQFHRFELRVPQSQVAACVTVLERAGYTRWEPWRRGAWTVYARTNATMTLVKSDQFATRVVLRWRDDARPAGPWSRFIPTNVDLGLVELPNALWSGYYLLRVLRAIKEKVTRRTTQGSISPFLGTPRALIPLLLEFAGLNNDDVLYDLGCGDARIVIEAARHAGCRAVGIERDSELVALARQSIRQQGLTEQVRIDHGDAEEYDVRDATVVFLFLAPSAIGKLLPALRRRVSPGTRVIAHEQLGFEVEPAPERCELVLSPGALTVARLWQF